MNENTSATSEPDDAPLPSDEMLRLIDAQELRVRRHFEAAYAWVLIAWAAAWFIGFGALWSNTTGGGNPWFRLPQPWAWIIFAVTLAAAIVASIVVSVLSNRGVRGAHR